MQVISLLPLAALICFGLGIRSYLRSERVRAACFAGAGLGLAALLAASAMLSRPAPAAPAPHAAASAASLPADPLDDDSRFDLIDMLPARAGGLILTLALPDKGTVAFTPEPKDELAVGRYDWIRKPGARVDDVPLAVQFRDGVYAKIECYRRSRNSDELCDTKKAVPVKVAGERGCFFPEERGCPFGTSSASSIEWSGCSVTFKCGTFGNYRAADAVPIAEDVDRWAKWFRSGRKDPAIPRQEVLANRRAVLDAFDLQWARMTPSDRRRARR